ncbi:class I SAM-dependent methyltransferase [Moheibacter sediminis]|uniref:Methyltransferase domain-containing protein n=1 Tax=Moheibacter sediminis TaxID=1434700 RepID=A0A1W1YHK1_9FLAO|nr:class I SAM-dependent methyltransferase [Moheibacter sediminis]SMC35281.1 Methyltransferase domain-containing protein [Moheibacter sediminis]
MNKIKKTFSALAEIIKNPWLLNHILQENSVWEKKVAQKYNLPNGLVQIQLNELFPDFSEELNSFSFTGGGSLPTDIALLKSLCRKFENASYFEIGTWRGESVKNVADVAKDCYTLNLSRQQIINLGMPANYADAHAFFSKGLNNVTHLEGDSRTFDYAGLNKKFDVIFIDGNHHHDFVVSDTKKVFENLIHENSIIVWHDYAYSPENVRFEVMDAILDGVPQEFHSNLYHVANTMCAIFVKGNFEVKYLDKYADPNITFKLVIDSIKLPE